MMGTDFDSLPTSTQPDYAHLESKFGNLEPWGWKSGNLDIWKFGNLEPWGWKSENQDIWKSRALGLEIRKVLSLEPWD